MTNTANYRVCILVEEEGGDWGEDPNWGWHEVSRQPLTTLANHADVRRYVASLRETSTAWFSKRARAALRMTCYMCGGPTSVSGQPCGEC